MRYSYDARGNLKTRTSSVDADIDVSAYGYDASKPNRLAGAMIEGKTYKFSHDADGNVEKYDCVPAACDDRFVEWGDRNLPVRITGGRSKTDKTPTARDEFAYGPDGARYHRKATCRDADGDLRTERTYHVGESEELLPHSGAEHTSIMRTRVSDAVRHVRTAKPGTDDKGNRTTVVESHFEYVQKDHLGSAEAITDAAGNLTRTLAHDPYGSRRKADWTAALTEAEIGELAGAPGPRERGHAGHEHLDRTGLINRGGRIHDPTLGRFLSPDPLVADPGSAQAWNGYSYVSNSPMSHVDPSGMIQAGPGCNIGGVMCLGGGSGAAGGRFGLASVVSTHRLQWVDVFLSFVPSWLSPGWGGSGGTPPYNPSPYYFWGGGTGGGGWNSYDSYDTFHFGIAFFSATFQVTSQVGVAGTPDITRRPMGVIRGIPGLVEGTASVLIPGYDLYECYTGEGCTTTDILFGTVEIAGTLTGVGYLGRVAFKGATRAYDAYKLTKAPKISSPYQRPSNATTRAQREFVQNKPCVNCGTYTSRQVADHKEPLVKEYYRKGSIDEARMRNIGSIQPQCPTCSARQGAEMSRFSRQKKEELNL